MAAQAAMKAPFRLGTKEVHLYVCLDAHAQFWKLDMQQKSADDHETDQTSQ
jgi:hypothetical protein